LKTLIKIIQQAQITIKMKRNINEILDKKIKRERKIERIVYLIGLIIGIVLGIKILIGMVSLIN
jgi:predicted nucleic acid-binding Zn ribbon protein